jgi:hypothetical protein
MNFSELPDSLPTAHTTSRLLLHYTELNPTIFRAYSYIGEASFGKVLVSARETADSASAKRFLDHSRRWMPGGSVVG